MEGNVKTRFDDDRDKVTVACNGAKITKTKVIHAIKAQNGIKVTGPNTIHNEILKVIVKQDASGLTLLTSLCNAIYASGKISSDWLKATFVTILKKPNSSQCDDYRDVSYVLKV